VTNSTTLEAEAILERAAPLTHQQAREIQPFGHLVRMPIALSEPATSSAATNCQCGLSRSTWSTCH
jgi:hypothetical protein